MDNRNDLQLLPGELADFPLIHRLERAYMADHEPHNIEAWQSAMHRHLEQWANCLPRTVVAAIGGEKVGYMFWERHASTATLASIHVKSNHRRRSIGSALLARFEQDARRLECGVAELHVLEANPAGLFYEAAGYGVIGSADPYVVLAKDLGARRDPS